MPHPTNLRILVMLFLTECYWLCVFVCFVVGGGGCFKENLKEGKLGTLW